MTRVLLRVEVGAGRSRFQGRSRQGARSPQVRLGEHRPGHPRVLAKGGGGAAGVGLARLARLPGPLPGPAASPCREPDPGQGAWGSGGRSGSGGGSPLRPPSACRKTQGGGHLTTCTNKKAPQPPGQQDSGAPGQAPSLPRVLLPGPPQLPPPAPDVGTQRLQNPQLQFSADGWWRWDNYCACLQHSPGRRRGSLPSHWPGD